MLAFYIMRHTRQQKVTEGRQGLLLVVKGLTNVCSDITHQHLMEGFCKEAPFQIMGMQA